MSKSNELSNFENKVKYLINDSKNVYESVKKLLIQGWNLGFDISKLIIQIISLWELIPKLPEVLKIGKYVNIGLSFIKNLGR